MDDELTAGLKRVRTTESQSTTSTRQMKNKQDVNSVKTASKEIKKKPD